MSALLVVAWLAYLPGLSGGFLFDDFVNLDALGKHGAIDDWPAFWRYVTSGTADPTGRPLSLLSFLLDARDWPADPRPFLRTNVLLHLLNGCLLFALLRRLGRHLEGPGPRTDAAALVGAGAWLLHPLFVSTTLYVVQREAMLPATFILLGLLAWIHGRQLHASSPFAGKAWMLLGMGAGTALAVLAKANGVLLPLLAWVLEATVLRAGDRDQAAAVARSLRWWRGLFLVLPTLAILGYLLARLPQLSTDLGVRPWTMGERLLTQPRVLVDYISLLLVPQALSAGLFNDAYQASSGLLQPVSTLPALLAVGGGVGLGIGLRRRAPAVAAAILFYFGGHLLESSVIPLELYFEHRNYLPALLAFWPLARALCRWRIRPAVRIGLGVALLAFLATVTWQRTSLWAQPAQLVRIWAAQNPASPRAQASAAIDALNSGRPDLALQRLEPLVARHPYELQWVLNHANAACLVGGLDAPSVARIENAMRSANRPELAWPWLAGMISAKAARPCPGVDDATLDRWIQALAANPMMRTPARRQDLFALSGQLALARAQPEAALAAFNSGLAADPRPEAAAGQAAMLASHGGLAEALAHLDEYDRLAAARTPDSGIRMPRLHRWVLRRQGYWEHELGTLKERIRHDLDARGQDAPLPRHASPR